MTDDGIVELYWARSAQAIPATDAQYGRYCRRIACNILRCAEDAEECVNDAYLAAWNSIPPHRPANLAAFLGKLTRRIALNRLSRRNAAKRGGEAALSIDELAECLPAGRTVEQEVEQEMQAKALSRAISRYLYALPREKRRVFVCRYWYCSSVKEISALFGFSETKTANMLSRIRSGLKRALEKEALFDESSE